MTLITFICLSTAFSWDFRWLSCSLGCKMESAGVAKRAATAILFLGLATNILSAASNNFVTKASPLIHKGSFFNHRRRDSEPPILWNPNLCFIYLKIWDGFLYEISSFVKNASRYFWSDNPVHLTVVSSRILQEFPAGISQIKSHTSATNLASRLSTT